MPLAKEYTIKIEEKAKEEATKELIRELSELKKAVLAGMSIRKDVSAEKTNKLLEQAITALSKNQKEFKVVIDKLVKELGVTIKPSKFPLKKEPDPHIELLGKQIKNLSKDLKELSAKKIAIVDIETGPIKKGGALGGKVDFITQIGVLTASLEDVLTKTAKELEKQVKNIYIKLPKEIKTEAKYKEVMEPITKRGIQAVPWKKLQLEEGAVKFSTAMNELAESIKDAEILIGHNIADFDAKILKDAFERAGTKIDIAAREYYDTAIAASKAFPKREAHALGAYRKDAEKAGKEYTKAAHDATADVTATADLVKALAGESNLLAAAEGDLTATLAGITKKIESVFVKVEKLGSAFEDLNKATSSTSAKVDGLGNTIDEMNFNDLKESINKAKKAVDEYTIDITRVSNITSAIQATVFKPSIVHPITPEAKYTYERGKGVPPGANIPYKTGDVDERISALAVSLKKLQENMVKALKEGLSEGVEILRTKEGKEFQLGMGAREWELKLVNVNDLRRALRESYGKRIPLDIDTREIVETYKSEYVKREEAYSRSAKEMAAEVYEWLRKYGKEEVAERPGEKGKADPYLKKTYGEFRAKGEGIVKQLEKDPRLEALYKVSVLQTNATKALTDKFLKVLAVPVAHITGEGTTAFKTKYGAERATAQFATITTGLEVLVKEFKDLGGAVREHATYLHKISRLPLKPREGEKEESEELAKTLVGRVRGLGGEETLLKGYKDAIKLRMLERGAIEEEIKEFDALKTTFTNLEKEAEKLNVTALDVANALNKIDFENFYDVLDRLYTAGKEPFLTKQAPRVMEWDRVLRNIAKVRSDLLGVMPLKEPGRPKRGEYEEQVLKVLTRRGVGELQPKEQKEHIREINLMWAEMVRNAEKLGEKIPKATSIDLSDAAASQFTEFNERSASALKGLNKVMISMSTAGLRGQAPFEEFASISRTMSQTANMLKMVQAEAPSIVSKRELEMMKSGKWGAGKVGLNVLTELRNTAGTFEDQIMISGRLAKAFTEIVKPLVRAAAEFGKIGLIEPGYKGISGKGKEYFGGKLEKAEYNELIEGVSSRIQEVLGIPERYRGRADIAKIGEEVENVMREHRGKSIEVQTAKITETFLNYFGRKLVTRFGTKGVAITPAKAPTEIKELRDIAEGLRAGWKAQVVPGAGLGFARVPKSMGQLMAEIFDEADVAKMFDPKVLDSLTRRLEESGNKFVLDLFKKASMGLVTEEEAKKQGDVFKEASEAFKRVFGKELPEDSIEAMKFIKKKHAEVATEYEPFELRPIEARISARGIAKRGLAPEILEVLINNLIGSTKESTTILSQAGKEGAENILTASDEMRKAINEYLNVLGYEPLKDLEAMEKRLRMEGASPEQIKELKAGEKQWRVYTKGINEFGEKIEDILVGQKYLGITEEPHIYKGWTEKEIEKGIKGERLNYQAFAAYAGIFGAGSSMLKELAEATTLSAEEGWELVRALQMIAPAMGKFKDSLEVVKLRDIKPFEEGTATLDELKGTLFDISKFPRPFKLRIPATKKERGPEEFYEEMYVPGPALRKTYPEELMGGRAAPTNISRYLSNLINAAQTVEDIYKASVEGELELSDKTMDKFARTVRAELTQTLTETYKEVAGIEAKTTVTPENVALMQTIIDKLKPALEKYKVPAPYARPAARQGIEFPTMLEAVESYEKSLTTDPKKYSKVLSRIMDMIIGLQPEAISKEEEKIEGALKKYRERRATKERAGAPVGPEDIPEEYKETYRKFGRGRPFEGMMASFRKRLEERKEAPTVFDLELRAGNLKEFANKVGIDLEVTVKQALERAMESLSMAKIAYFEQLGKAVIGPKHAIEKTFFQRTIPAITGKAISAITDKTEELQELLDYMVAKEYDIKIRTDLGEIIDKHKDYIAKSKQLGLPVLKEKEIGISPQMAKALKVRGAAGEFTDLAQLIEKREKMTKKELEQLQISRDVFVESVRYPFYGTVSVQPHKARLMEATEAKHAITVPGAPELDLPQLREIIDALERNLGLLVERREAAWAPGGGGGVEAEKLTAEIDGLVRVIAKATPTFINMEQKLDYDGDALFLHTGQLEESRKEIAKHFEALGQDILAVRSLFSTFFTAVKETDVRSISEMANIFAKKHPAEKGYAWLTRPEITKDVGQLNIEEVKEALFSYTEEATRLKNEIKELEKAGTSTAEIKKFRTERIKEWTGALMEKDIQPIVYQKLGGPTAAEAGMEPARFEERVRELTEELSRRRLEEQKYSDAIVGQLYKLHTGQTVEAISRLARMTELETGFGRGLAKTGKEIYKPSEEFLERWPKESIALGGRPVQEFAARMNEIMRFVIQKGMDEKHAGVEAVGTEILSNVAKKGGARTIMKVMREEEDQFGDLWDFNDQIIKSAKLRLGALSTKDLQVELKKFEVGRMSFEDLKKEVAAGGGEIPPDAPREIMAEALIKAAKEADISKDREQIINEIIGYIDLEAIFEELFRMIKRTAIKGLTKELEIGVAELPPEKRVRKQAEIARAGGYESFARGQIEKEAVSEKGISLLKHVTGGLQPLYRMRTSMEDLASAAKRTKIQFEMPEMILPVERADELRKIYEDTLKTAHVLSRSMAGTVTGAGGGVHSLMVLSALEKRYKDLEKISTIAQKAEVPEEYGAELVKKNFQFLRGSAVAEVPKLISDVWTKAEQEAGIGEDIPKDIYAWASSIKKAKEIASRQIDELSQILSIPPLAPEEEFEAFGAFTKKHPEALKKLSSRIEVMAKQTEKIPEEDMDEMIEKFQEQAEAFLRFQVGMSEQLKRVSEGMRAIPFQKETLAMAFPRYEAAIGKGPTKWANEMTKMEGKSREEKRKRIIEDREDYDKRIERHWKEQSLKRQREVVESVEAYKAPSTESIRDVVIATLEEVSEATQKKIEETTLQQKILALRALEEKAKGPREKGLALYKQYRPSGLYGGGGYGGVPQPEMIRREMLGKTEEISMIGEAAGFVGTDIHRQKQKEFIEKYGDVDVEGLVEDAENMIAGYYDVLFKTATSEKWVVDIKSISDPKKFEAIAKIAKEMQEKKLTLSEYMERISIDDVEIARRLETYLSQVNFYLSQNLDALGGLLIVSMDDPTKEVKLKLGKFDPARFEKDIEAVKKARSQIEETIKNITDETVRKVFIETLPKASTLESLRAVADEPEKLTPTEQKLYSKWSREYRDAVQKMSQASQEQLWEAAMAGIPAPAGGAAAPPPTGGPPGTPPTGGDGDDEYEKLRQKVEEVLGRGGDLGYQEALALLEAIDQAERSYRDNLIGGTKELAQKYLELIESMDESFQKTYKGGRAEIEKLRQAMAAKMEELGLEMKGKVPAPEIEMGVPEAVKKAAAEKGEPYARTEYLKEMLRRSTRHYDLLGKGMKYFGKEIESLLEETLVEGPGEVSGKILAAIERLEPQSRKYITDIWQYYRKNVGEFFIRQLGELENQVKEATSEQAEKKAFDQYQRTLEAFISNIKRSLSKRTDIFTRPGFGGMREWVSPELAKGAGVYRPPRELAEIAKQSSGMSGEFQDIFETLIGDLGPMMEDSMLTPLEKVRVAFQMLAKEDVGLKAILEDADLFRRIGEQAIKAWDFDRLVKGITQLRAGLQQWNRLQISGFGAIGGAEDYTETQRKNIEDTIKYVKQLESMLAPVGGPAGSPLGMTQVPQFLAPKEQELLHKRNIALVKEYYKTTEKMGGPQRGERLTYRQRIIDPGSKQVLKDTSEEFKKLGDAADGAGGSIGIFSRHTTDLIKAMQQRRGVTQAFGRVIKWGLASTVVRGSVRALQDMVSVIGDVELGIAILRQVMSPLETNFEEITQAAINFAKQFGQPILSVIDSMRVFAQQGLAQEEVISRARTSQIAANVTTLSSSDATEALTAAMKVYGKEGQGTLRFLDSWSQVEARHAITSKDLAQGMMKAAAVAKTSGITFDELNAIITGIGETSRQTGREIGTSLRFMFRRIQAQKGPAALAQVGVPVVGPAGELRKGFDILGDLAERWGELTNAQRLSIAQAIGGRRHYNSLIILMDHWGDALDTLEDSINSKGAAERRNAIVMETYAKRLQQVRAAMVELQVQFGKLFLPVAKVLVTGLKGVLETIANIPNSVKIAALAVASLFALFGKGQDFVSGFIDRFRVLPGYLKEFADEASKELKIGIFEVFGKVPKKFGGIETRGLKTMVEATNIGELESILGKVGFKAAEFGRSWNSMLSEIAVGGATTVEVISKLFGKFGTLLELGGTALLGKGPWAAAIGGILETAAVGAGQAEGVFQKIAKAIGVPAEKLAEWTKGNTSFVKSVMPMVASLAALTPVALKVWDSMKKLALSAEDYEKSMAPERRRISGELQDLRSLSNSYTNLSKTIEDVAKTGKPEVKERAIRREEYRSPLFATAKIYKKVQKFGNELARTNFELVESFDEFGNAILKTNRSLEEHIDLLTSAKMQEAAKEGMGEVGKYIEDLTGGKGFTETFKYELKRFVKEIPAIGGLLAKHISISPAKELDVVRDKMTKILSLREKYPLTTALEPMYEKYYKQLEDARKRFASTYRSFRRILTDLPTRGMKPIQIKDLLDTEEIRKGFELMIRVEPRFKVAEMEGKIDWKDLLGAEILKRMYPEKPLDFAAPLTKELLLEGKMLLRSGKAFAGDVVLFNEEVNKAIIGKGLDVAGIGKGLDVAGRQGVLKFKEGIGFFVQYVTREMRDVKEVPFSAVEKFVDAIFPTISIQERMQENLATLTEFIAGAAAGMAGITEREFKRSFNLGERFFAQIPTTTLLQTTKGWAPGRGYGEMPYKGAGIPRTAETPFEDLTKRWDEWMQTFWFEPQASLKMMLEPAEKLAMAGEVPGKAMMESITGLLDVLKNNQIVIQYRALHEDLMKTLNEGSRVLKENIAIEKVRNQYLVQTSGFLRGMPEDLSDINLGINEFSTLTAQQRILFREKFLPPEEREFTQARVEYREARIQREARVGQLESVARARTQLAEIRETAVGLGAALSPEDVMSMAKSITIAGNKPLGLIWNEEKKVVANTRRIAETMDELLAQSGDPDAAARVNVKHLKEISKHAELVKTDISAGSLKDISSNFGYLVKLRSAHEKADRKDLVKAIDASLNKLSSTLVEKVGFRKALTMFEKRPRLAPSPAEYGLEAGKYLASRPGEFTKQEFIRRSVGELGLRELIQVLKKYVKPTTEGGAAIRSLDEYLVLSELGMPRSEEKGGIFESKTFKSLEKEIADQTTIGVTTSKNMQKMFAAYAGFQDIFRRSANREAKYFEVQIGALKEQRKSIVDQLKAGTIPKEEAKKSISGINKRIVEMAAEKKKATATAEERATKEAIGLIATAATTFVRATGLSETALKGLGAVAAGALITWHTWSLLTGKPIPEYIKDLGDKAKEAAKKTGIFGKAIAGRALKKAISRVEEEMAKKRPIFTEEEKEKIRKMKDLQVGEKQLQKADDMLKGIKKGDVEKLATDKQILNENKQQTDILLGIHDALDAIRIVREEKKREEDERKTGEQSQETKKQTSDAKQLRDRIDVIKAERLKEGDIGTKIRDFLTVALLTTTAGYVADIQAFGAELGEYEEKAKKISGLVVKLMEKFPTEVEGAMEILRKERAKRKEALAKPDVTEEERVSIVADQQKAYEEASSLLMESAKRLGIDIIKDGEIIAGAIGKMNLSLAGEKIAQDIEGMGRAVVRGISDFMTDFKYNLELVGAMKGLPRFEELPIGKAMYELTPTERLMKIGGEARQNMYKEFKVLSMYRDQLLNSMKDVQAGLFEKTRGFLQDPLKRVKREIRGTDPSEEVKRGMGLPFVDLKKEVRESMGLPFVDIRKEVRKDMGLKEADRLVDVIVEISELEKERAEILAMGAVELDNFNDRLQKVTDRIVELTAKFAEGLAISGLMGELDKLANSFKVSARSAKFNREAIDKLLGGPHPEAIQEPTMASLRGATILGLPPEKAWMPTRWEIMEQERVAAGEPLTPGFRYKKAQAKERATYLYYQREQNKKLMQQYEGVRGVRETAIIAKYAAESKGQPGIAKNLETIIARFDTIMKTYTDRYDETGQRYLSKYGTLEKEKIDIERRLGGPVTGDLRESLMAELARVKSEITTLPEEEKRMRYAYKGDQGELKDIRADLSEQLKELGIEEDAITGPITEALKMADNDIVNAIQAGVLTLAEILTGAELGPEAIEKSRSRFLDLFRDFGKAVVKIASQTTVGEKGIGPGSFGGLQSGGKITGPGGPKEDRIPIMSSAGEYVIKTSSAKHIGYNALNYMNSAGRLPGFKDGGRTGFQLGGVASGVIPWTEEVDPKTKLSRLREYETSAKKHIIGGTIVYESGGVFSTLHPKTRELITSPKLLSIKQALGVAPREPYEPPHLATHRRAMKGQPDYNAENYNWTGLTIAQTYLRGLGLLKMDTKTGKVWGKGWDHDNNEFNISKDNAVPYWDFLNNVYYGAANQPQFESIRKSFMKMLELNPLGDPGVIRGRSVGPYAAYWLGKAGKTKLPDVEELQKMYPQMALWQHPAMKNILPGLPIRDSELPLTAAPKTNLSRGKDPVEQAVDESFENILTAYGQYGKREYYSGFARGGPIRKFQESEEKVGGLSKWERENPNLYGLMGVGKTAAVTFGQGLLEAVRIMTGYDTFRNITEGKGTLVDYADAALMVAPIAMEVRHLTRGLIMSAEATGGPLIESTKYMLQWTKIMGKGVGSKVWGKMSTMSKGALSFFDDMARYTGRLLKGEAGAIERGAPTKFSKEGLELGQSFERTQKPITTVAYRDAAKKALDPTVTEAGVDKMAKDASEYIVEKAAQLKKAGNVTGSMELAFRNQGPREFQEAFVTARELMKGKKITPSSAAPNIKDIWDFGVKRQIEKSGIIIGEERTKEKGIDALKYLASGAFAQGGSLQDNIPILASNGEFMFNREAAKSIGYGNLNFMNKTGKLPGFAKGGAIGVNTQGASVPVSIGNAFVPVRFQGGLIQKFAEGKDVKKGGLFSRFKGLFGKKEGDVKDKNAPTPLQYAALDAYLTTAKEQEREEALATINNMVPLKVQSYFINKTVVDHLKKIYPDNGKIAELIGKIKNLNVAAALKAIDTTFQSLPDTEEYGSKKFYGWQVPSDIGKQQLDAYILLKLQKKMGGLIQKFQAGGEIIGRKIGGAVTKAFGAVPKYKEGINYVPRDQLAYVHKGEAIIPAGYQDGGQVAGINVDDLASKIKTAVEDAIKGTKLEVDIDTTDLPTIKVDTTDLPTIKVDTTGVDASVDRLSQTLSNPIKVEGVGAVGAADGDTEIRELRELIEGQLSVLERAVVEDKRELDEKIISAKNEINANITDLQTKTDGKVATADIESGIEKRISQAVESIRADYGHLPGVVTRLEITVQEAKSAADRATDNLNIQTSLGDLRGI